MNNKIKMRIKYFENATKLKKIAIGNWIDVYARKDIFVELGKRAMIPLGFALELPDGWEAWLAPRSSTEKTWGVIQPNSVGIIDTSYSGDNDEFHMPVFCVEAKDTISVIKNRTVEGTDIISPMDVEVEEVKGSWIRQGSKIGQFRIIESMPEIVFEEVASLGNADRGGFGTTGRK